MQGSPINLFFKFNISHQSNSAYPIKEHILLGVKTKDKNWAFLLVESQKLILRAYTRSQDQSMSKWLSTYVAPFWHQNFLDLIQQNTPYNFLNQTHLLGLRCTLMKPFQVQ
jgi:hypothetical protein